MMTTTVRFDRGSWTKLSLHAERLEIAKAAFIRDATIVQIARLESEESLLREPVSDVLLGFGIRLDHIEQWIRRGGR